MSEIKSPIASPPKANSFSLKTDRKSMISENIEDALDEYSEEPVFIAVAGGTASGKTTICQSVISYLKNHQIVSPTQRVCLLSQDSFYRNLTPEESERALRQDFNFDSPDAFDFRLMHQIILDIKARKPVKIPVYDFSTNSRKTDEFILIEKADVIILEGILVLYDEEILPLMSMKLFVDCDSDIRLARRIRRDIKERGRSVESVLTQYLKFVKPAYDDLILPTKRWADLIIQNGSSFKVAVRLICAQIRLVLQQRLLRSESPAPVHRSPPLMLG
ncbi:Uridine kinase [Monocercomonoides exilis]|uniref:Uridine kinase n=1 Tax=Monocercomonoides exilis TaxID=2049356 RepID=UPI0035599D4F|nr:Uridine kinase [Monocercomonoides exilis]|eukprot:MONOS_6760.1-p1 / transcript=MONOS_6760.1 / gene=MONOS_6760 / organism=Monocercomonoides_exilis_PA203 / gene_product=Uridine kinase [EC:2.7.1.48] / transcript_product=Uridine kinase [EC:2.7.1.48] / location=Mono_scaffold00219:7280-8445(-) / protein_length=275 / sequence_SO=supercontig / SO=protein_coding / is_pseudo=false